MKTESLASWEDKIRPLLRFLPPAIAVRIYSRGRQTFIRGLARHLPSRVFSPYGHERTLWGIRFRSPIMNAAGMFKTGDGYAVAFRQGAGAFLAGTTTGRPREGNRRRGVSQPFVPYPASGAASNWLGLPNPGHRRAAAKLAELERDANCPVGASVAACPDGDLTTEQKLESLVVGMQLYEEAGVDFLEMNESCPNTEEAQEGRAELAALEQRLAYVAEHFLERRRRVLPVIVKLSCDTAHHQVMDLVALLIRLGFDGVNFGNTSIAYAARREQVAPAERRHFDYFVKAFGGGVSGRPLQCLSLDLASAAVAAAEAQSPPQEFHVVRTGGLETAHDLFASERAGVALNQWYSGYFAAFAHWGDGLYRELLQELDGLASSV